MSRPKMVFDTNIYVRALLSPDGGSARLLRLLKARKITLLTSNTQIAELKATVKHLNDEGRRKVRPEALEALLFLLCNVAELVPGRRQHKVSPDSDDDFIIAIAVKGKADYLVSENQKHVHQGLIPKGSATKVLNVKDAFVELKKHGIIK